MNALTLTLQRHESFVSSMAKLRQSVWIAAELTPRNWHSGGFEMDHLFLLPRPLAQLHTL